MQGPRGIPVDKSNTEGNEQLKKENPSIREENEMLKTANKSITELDEQLKKENQSLREENQSIRKENEKLKKFISILKEKRLDMTLFESKEYEEGQKLGEGATSTVTEVMKREKYAKKVLTNFDQKTLQRFLHESEILFELRHPCIVRMYGFDYGDSNHPPSIFLSLEPKSLETSIQNNELDNHEKNRITVEIVLGMRYIHSKNLMHRDLKPANILLSDNKHVRISDFGLAKEEDIETSQSKGVGTLRFMAPELFKDDIEYTSKVDVYSFGIILIFIITNQYPKFNLADVVTSKFPALPSAVVGWVVDLIHRCLSASPDNRPSFDEILRILKSHSYDLFNSNESNCLTSQQKKNQQEIERRILKIEAFEYQIQH